MTTHPDPVVDHYSTGATRPRIEQALQAAGKDLDALTPDDLAPLEDFHTLGRIATAALIESARVSPTDRVLDAGSGIGGTARYVAAAVGAHVTAVDLTAEYCDVAQWLNATVGLADRIDVRQADVCAMPFAAESFDIAVTQHVQMNIADKPAFFAELRRVLAPGGRLAFWDVVAGAGGPLHFPVPWASDPAHSHLATAGELRSIAERQGFIVQSWDDLTEPAATAMAGFFAAPPGPLGLHAFVPDFPAKARNLIENLQQGRAGLIRAVLTAA